MTATIHRHDLGLTWLGDDAMARAAHAVVSGDRVWLIDPFEDAVALAAAAELGRPAGVVQLLDRHNRDCAQIARRLEVVLHRLPTTLPDSPFSPFPVVSARFWNEVGLWDAQARTMIVAEAVGTGPLFGLGRPLGVHPMLRLFPPRAALSGYRPQRLLVGHGPPLLTGAEEALRAALAASRSDLPKLALKLPEIVRGG